MCQTDLLHTVWTQIISNIWGKDIMHATYLKSSVQRQIHPREKKCVHASVTDKLGLCVDFRSNCLMNSYGDRTSELGFPSDRPWVCHSQCLCSALPAIGHQLWKSKPLCCKCASLPKHSKPKEQWQRWNPVCTRRSVNPLSAAERGEGEEDRQHVEALTQLITHSDNSDVLKEWLLQACP